MRQRGDYSTDRNSPKLMHMGLSVEARVGSRLFTKACDSLKVMGQYFKLALIPVLVIAVCSPQRPLRPERGLVGDQFVHEKLDFWQHRLKLQDWKITVLSVHPNGLRPHTLGNIHWDADKKTAAIRVLNASDYQTPLPAALNDMEFTIVHELIHLELISLPRSEASRSDEEYAINHLADALLQREHQD
jgi:hypothetical protein